MPRHKTEPTPTSASSVSASRVTEPAWNPVWGLGPVFPSGGALELINKNNAKPAIATLRTEHAMSLVHIGRKDLEELEDQD